MAVAPEPTTLTVGSALWSFLAGLGGAAIPLWVMWVKLRLDQLSARSDAFAKAVEAATDLALEYWLNGIAEIKPTEPSETEPAKAETAEQVRKRNAELLKQEVRLRGAQTGLQADVERMVVDLPEHFRPLLRAEFRNVIDGMTGEPFGDRNEYTVPDKAMAVVSSGSRLVRVVREGRDEVSKLRYMLGYVTGISSRTTTSATIFFGLTIFAHEILPLLLFIVGVLIPSAVSVCKASTV